MDVIVALLVDVLRYMSVVVVGLFALMALLFFAALVVCIIRYFWS